MPKINEFVLQDNIINLMRRQLDDSRDHKIESGFTMCANKDNIIEAKNITKRTDKEIFLSYSCPSGFNSVGTYHTHPDAISNASPRDLLNACGHIGDCIGGSSDNKIKCYIRKKDADQSDCIKEFSEKTSIELDLRKRFEDYERRKKQLLEEKINLSMIEPRTRKVDMEIREIAKKMKEYNTAAIQFNKEIESSNQKLLVPKNKYFDEIEIR